MNGKFPDQKQLPIIPVISCTNQKQDEEDPLRELVLCSKNEQCEPNKLNDLAVKAANLQQTEEISAKPAPNAKSLAGIFAGTETIVKKVEETIKKKYVALEPSDSEGFGGIRKK